MIDREKEIEIKYGISEADRQMIKYCNGFIIALFRISQEMETDEEIISLLIEKLLEDFVHSIKRNIVFNKELKKE